MLTRINLYLYTIKDVRHHVIEDDIFECLFQLNSESSFYWSFIYIRKTYIVHVPKPQVGSNWLKSLPPFLPFGEINGSCSGTWHNFMHQYSMHHWTSHWWWLGRKAPPPRIREKILHWTYPFQAILSNFGFCGRKAPPPAPPRMIEKLFTLHISISANFKQLWFLWQKSPPTPTQMRKNVLHWIYPFQAISRNYGFCDRKAPLKGWRKHFLHWIYPFQAILSNFGFCSRNPPPQDEGKCFYTGSIHFRQFWATMVFMA